MVEHGRIGISGVIRHIQRRIGSNFMLRHEIWAWEAERNAKHATIDWRFTCRDARHRLRLYPS